MCVQEHFPIVKSQDAILVYDTQGERVWVSGDIRATDTDGSKIYEETYVYEQYLEVKRSEVSRTHSDYTFTWTINKEIFQRYQPWRDNDTIGQEEWEYWREFIMQIEQEPYPHNLSDFTNVTKNRDWKSIREEAITYIQNENDDADYYKAIEYSKLTATEKYVVDDLIWAQEMQGDTNPLQLTAVLYDAEQLRTQEVVDLNEKVKLIQILKAQVMQNNLDPLIQYESNYLQLCAILDFTAYFAHTQLTMNAQQIVCEGQKYTQLSHCKTLEKENIIEIGMIESYPLNRIDVDDDFFYEFWPGSFTIKNLPTPYYVHNDLQDHPIRVRFTNGTNADPFNPFCTGEPVLFQTVFANYVPKPGDIDDFGIQISNQEYPNDPDKQELVVQFLPSVDIQAGSYFDITFPWEIKLPESSLTYDDYQETQMHWRFNTQITCDSDTISEVNPDGGATIECHQLATQIRCENAENLVMLEDTTECYRFYEMYMKDDVLHTFKATNRVRVDNAFTGKNLTTLSDYTDVDLVQWKYIKVLYPNWEEYNQTEEYETLTTVDQLLADALIQAQLDQGDSNELLPVNYNYLEPDGWNDPFIPEPPYEPAWVKWNTTVEENLVYVDGELVNLDTIIINNGTYLAKSWNDILSIHTPDQRLKQIRDDHTTLIYYAKLYQSEVQAVNFTRIYSLQANNYEGSGTRQKSYTEDYDESNWQQGREYIIDYPQNVYYAVRFFDVELFEPDIQLVTSNTTFFLQIYGQQGLLQMQSNSLDKSYFIDFKKTHSFHYTKYDDWARCTAEIGCVEKMASVKETNALIDFYDEFGGPSWKINDNWKVGDPCLNYWYGVQCNVKGEVIVLHFFENHLEGGFPESFVDLKNLKHLSIFNGDREFEGQPNLNANTVTIFPNQIFELVNLEEINLSKLEMGGKLTNGSGNRSILSLNKLRFINLSNNLMSNNIPNTMIDGHWRDFTQLEIIELQNNVFQGQIPSNWMYLTQLTYVNASQNSLSGSIPILTEAQKLEGIDFTDNKLQDFPWAYFAEDKFQNLEFINVNQNDLVKMPEKCIRIMYCYKKTLIISAEGIELNPIASVPRVDGELNALIERSYDEKEYQFINL